MGLGGLGPKQRCFPKVAQKSENLFPQDNRGRKKIFPPNSNVASHNPNFALNSDLMERENFSTENPDDLGEKVGKTARVRENGQKQGIFNPN